MRMFATVALVVMAGVSMTAVGPDSARAGRAALPGMSVSGQDQQAPPAPAAAPAAKPEGRTEILEQILVKVNGEIFTKTDLEDRQITSLRQRGTPQMTDEELRRAIGEVTPGLLVDAVDELLLLQRGTELGYKVSDEQFKRILDNIRKENKLEDDAQFAAALKQEGMELATLRKNIERNMVVGQVQQVEVFSRIAVAEDEAKAYYSEHAAEFASPAQLTLRELSVVVRTDGKTINVSLDEAAKAKAEAALARIRGGEAFEKVVAEISDSDSKTNGGLVGPVNEADLDPTIKKLIEPLKPGECTEVFRTRAGWAVLKLESLTRREVKTFDQARDQISEKVAASKRRDEMMKYLQKLRTQAIIDWKNAEMKKLWETRIAEESAPPTK